MDWLTGSFSGELGVKWLSTAVLLVTIIFIRWAMIRLLRRSLEADQVYNARKAATYAATFIIVLSLGWIWVDAFDNLATYLGLASAGVAIALSDLLKNLAGWLYILARRPFRIDDRIEVGSTRGDVVDIRLFRFTLMEIGNWVDADQSTGRLVHVPNGVVFTQNIANYTQGFEFIWHEVPVLITFESDWRAAKQILTAVLAEHAPDIAHSGGQSLREASHKYRIKVGALTPIVYTTVRDSGILLTARFLIGSRTRRGVEERIWEAILDEFAMRTDIELAYPTTRTYLQGPVNLTIDKPGETPGEGGT